ncbi:MAG: 1,4-alpha-glucan branching protein GlgB, partial [Myxococcales bacterium]|nr:1,4-alpha-glucan branching protein GlgB [Myxococcales bacterium]
GSWGYQTTGYFAPTHRHGKPQDLMYLVDLLHQAGIGVLLDITPAHFPADDFALARYDGTCLYEHEDPRRGRHPDWDTLIFNYGRREVVSFLQSAAMLWLERYHFDGLRVDAVASMLYLDYSRKDGEWLPNERGGRENLEAVAFLQALNQAVHARVPGAITIAEESTAWPGVTAPVEAGGLGFDMKWDMGWMHDTLRYLGRDPLFRSHHHDELTFRQLYAQDERFMLPLSHDEVVHGKRSLLGKMHGDAEGDPWRALAHLRLLLAYQFTMPGKKLLFMGSELASPREWDHDRSLDWHLGDEPGRAGVMRALERLADLYRGWPALHEGDFDPEGFSWVVVDDRERSVYAYLRRPQRAGAVALVILNFTPVPRPGYSLPAPGPGPWRVILNTDAAEFGGSGGAVRAELDPADGEPALVVDLPPLAALILRGDEARA